MSDVVRFKLDMFSERLGESFEIVTEAGTLVVELIEADGRDPAGLQFSLVFHDPNGSVAQHLPQSIYSLRNANLEPMDLFLVPIGPDKQRKGMCYEAVFAYMD